MELGQRYLLDIEFLGSNHCRRGKRYNSSNHASTIKVISLVGGHGHCGCL